MPGGSTQKQTQQEQAFRTGTQSSTELQQQQAQRGQVEASTTAPWIEAQPLLKSILGTLQGAPTAPTGATTDAIRWLESNARNAPSFVPQATDLTSTLFAGGGAPDYSGILNTGYDRLTGQLMPFASGGMIGKNEALQGQLDVMANDVANDINSRFAMAGRPTGTNAAGGQAIARGVMQGTAPVIAAQYNTDVQRALDAARELFGASGSTASGLTNLAQTRLGNRVAGLSAAQALPGILNAPAESLLRAGGLEQALPFGGVGLLEQLTLPIAGLGAQSTGTATGASSGSGSGTYSGRSTGETSSVTGQKTDPLSNIIGGITGGLGLLGASGALGSAGWLAPLLLSDERAKEDIAPVGVLNSGENVYAFRYRGDPSRKTHIGLLAQEVEDVTPEAVHEVGGVKLVDYRRATAPARAIGILNELALAA